MALKASECPLKYTGPGRLDLIQSGHDKNEVPTLSIYEVPGVGLYRVQVEDGSLGSTHTSVETLGSNGWINVISLPIDDPEHFTPEDALQVWLDIQSQSDIVGLDVTSQLALIGHRIASLEQEIEEKGADAPNAFYLASERDELKKLRDRFSAYLDARKAEREQN